VEYRAKVAQGERARGGGSRLDRADTADEAVETAELAVGRGDEEERRVGGRQGGDPTVRGRVDCRGRRGASESESVI
jgi:hypothetical protein